MTRSALRNLTLLILFIMAAIAGLLWWQTQKVQTELQGLQATLDAKKTELANLNIMTEAQAKLDDLTLDERASTWLDILKYVGLEQTNFNFQGQNRETKTVGDGDLIVRGITLDVQMPYQDALALADKLYNAGKIQVLGVTVNQVQDAKAEGAIQLSLKGRLFSLAKKGPEPGAAP